MKILPYYLNVRQNAIVRITEHTPAYIRGVFFEHLTTCVAICLISADQKRQSFIHLDSGTNLESLEIEINWLGEGWQLKTFENDEYYQARINSDIAVINSMTINKLIAYIKDKKQFSHWKNRMKTTTTCAFISRDLGMSIQPDKSIHYNYFREDKVISSITSLNFFFESCIDGGIFYPYLYKANIDYDGMMALGQEPVIATPPVPLPRVLHVLGSLIVAFEERSRPFTSEDILSLLPTVYLSVIPEVLLKDNLWLVNATLMREIETILKFYFSNKNLELLKPLADYVSHTRAVTLLNKIYGDRVMTCTSFSLTARAQMIINLIKQATNNSQDDTLPDLSDHLRKAHSEAGIETKEMEDNIPQSAQSLSTLLFFARKNPGAPFSLHLVETENSSLAKSQ